MSKTGFEIMLEVQDQVLTANDLEQGSMPDELYQELLQSLETAKFTKSEASILPLFVKHYTELSQPREPKTFDHLRDEPVLAKGKIRNVETEESIDFIYVRNTFECWEDCGELGAGNHYHDVEILKADYSDNIAGYRFELPIESAHHLYCDYTNQQELQDILDGNHWGVRVHEIVEFEQVEHKIDDLVDPETGLWVTEKLFTPEEN